MLRWEPVASEIQPYLLARENGGLGTWPWLRGSTTKIFGKAKKGFRFALKPVTIWRLASFDRPVFAGATLDQNIEIQEKTKDDQ